MMDANTRKNLVMWTEDAFSHYRITEGLSALTDLVHDCQDNTLKLQAESLQVNYSSMLATLSDGMVDEERNRVQDRIVRQGMQLTYRADRDLRLQAQNDHYSKIRHQLELVYLPDIEQAITNRWAGNLTPDEEQQVEDHLFDLLWTAPEWTAKDTSRWFEFISRQNPLVQQHLAGAVFLSCWEYYDEEKLTLLFLLADGERAVQRALLNTGLMLLAQKYNELISRLQPDFLTRFHTRDIREHVAEVQQEILQIYLTLKDDEQERHEIAEAKAKDALKMVEVLMKIKMRHLRYKLEHHMDPNLGKMELLRNCKFLSLISHWWMPFDLSSPTVQRLVINQQGDEDKSLTRLLSMVAGCDIDKFALFETMADNHEAVEAMKQNAEEAGVNEEGAVAAPSNPYRRAVHNLYRFFSHSQVRKEMFNPFKERHVLLLLEHQLPQLPAVKVLELCSAMKDCDMKEDSLHLLEGMMQQRGSTFEMLQLAGELCDALSDEQKALHYFLQAELLAPDDQQLVKSIALAYFYLKQFGKSIEYLERNLGKDQWDETQEVMLMSMYKMEGLKEKMLQLMYQRDLKKSTEFNIAEICRLNLELGKMEAAGRYATKLEQLDDLLQWKSFLTLGHFHLIKGQWKQALENYVAYARLYNAKRKEKDPSYLEKFLNETEVLTLHKVSRKDIMLMLDLLKKSL